MLILPLLSNFLLLDHHCISLLFMSLIPLLLFEKHVLKMGHLEITLICEFIDTTMMDNLLAVEFSKCAFLLITQLVCSLAESFVVILVPFIVAL